MGLDGGPKKVCPHLTPGPVPVDLFGNGVFAGVAMLRTLGRSFWVGPKSNGKCPFRERCETEKVARRQRRTDRPGPPGGTEAGRGGGVLRRLLPQPTSGIRPQNQEDQCVAFRVPATPRVVL